MITNVPPSRNYNVVLTQSMVSADEYDNGCDQSQGEHTVDQDFDLSVFNSADLFDNMPASFFQGHEGKSSLNMTSETPDIDEKIFSNIEPRPIGGVITIMPSIPLDTDTKGISSLYESGLHNVLCHDSCNAGMLKEKERECNGPFSNSSFAPLYQVHQDRPTKGMSEHICQVNKVVQTRLPSHDPVNSVDISDSHVQSHDSEMTKQEQALKHYQNMQWHKRFRQLVAFYRAHGHCVVPRYYQEPSFDNDGDDDSQHEDADLSRPKRRERSSGLSHWVRQRYQYKLKCQGLPSRLSDERQAKLEALGFCWNAHTSAWDTKFASLLRFFHTHGHADVPSCYAQDQSLSTWVKGQRRQMHLWKKTGKSTLTLKRKEKLDALGFNWNPRNL